MINNVTIMIYVLYASILFILLIFKESVCERAKIERQSHFCIIMADLLSFFSIDLWLLFSPTGSFLSGICGILVYCYLNHNDKKKKNSARQKPLPPKGPSFSEFFPNGIKAENQLALIAKHGNIFTIPSPIPGIIPIQVVVNEPDIVKELCVRQANMYRNPSNFTTRSDIFANATRQVMGNSVTGLKGDEWHWRKKALIKEFHRNRLLSDDRGLLAVILKEGKSLCDELTKAADSNSPIEIDVLTTKAAAGVVLFFLFGRRITYDAQAMRQSAKDMIDILLLKLLNPFYNLAKHIPGTGAFKTEMRLKKAQKVFDDIAEKELDLLLEEYRGTKSVHPDRIDGSVIASLIANEPRFQSGGRESMIEEARVFINAGFDTTSHSLAFAMGMMAERPDLANQMAKQGMEIFGKDSSSCYDVERVKIALQQVPLVNNFFHESLRLYPLTPALTGECINEINIVSKDGSEYTLPKGTNTMFLNFPLQRQVHNPDKIRPDRWDALPSEQPFLHTFQTGAHTCPGKPLSILEARVLLLLVAMQFEFEFPNGVNNIQYDDTGILRPKNGMPLLVKKRKM